MEQTHGLALVPRACTCLLLLMPGWALAQTGLAAEQLERARLLRQLLETRPDDQPAPDIPRLAGARIEPASETAAASGRRQQFEDAQWRALLGDQQGKIHAPPTQAIPESQWRAQAFDRERRAQDLSADILRLSREFLSNSQH